jgi:hypothetical protein
MSKVRNAMNCSSYRPAGRTCEGKEKSFSDGKVRTHPLAADRALVNRAAEARLGHTASIPCAIRYRSPEALALGAAVIACRRRYHCPERGCLLNRSRDCSRLVARGHCMPASLSLSARLVRFVPTTEVADSFD